MLNLFLEYFPIRPGDDLAAIKQELITDILSLNGQPTAYVCQRQTASAPITNAVTLSQMLQLPQRPQPGALPQ